MKKEIVGIDVSKSTLDAWLHFKQKHKVFQNSEKGFIELMTWSLQTSQMDAEHLVFCLEFTGMYSMALSVFLDKQKVCFYMVSGLAVKRSLGLARGKSDKVDAKNLARYVYEKKENLVPYQLPSQKIIRLKELWSFRDKLVRHINGHKAYLKEIITVLKVKTDDLLALTTREMIEAIEGKIKLTEDEMLQIIKSDESLSQSYELIKSIKGVGLVLSIAMIVSSNNFESFKTWRKFACYAGIAPFEDQSGTSRKRKTRVSNLGNRQMKTLLHMAAMTAIQFNPEMKLYYQKRIANGKSKMSTINVVRNKLLSRMFAVVERKSPFVDILKYAA